ncbi:WhiB family transcriptional regulator [Mycolicibacterium litorale]|uniref:WhiB family transcriptional regulator n=1 Tax=Mycolicibacterium litorale TaxID=758802 RepID=UPI003CF3D1BF
MITHRRLQASANVGSLALPGPLWDRWSWQTRGRCRDYPAELFFPESEGRDGLRRREEAAKDICRQCPVIHLCREHALRTPEPYGIWGATTPRERAGTSRIELR